MIGTWQSQSDESGCPSCGQRHSSAACCCSPLLPLALVPLLLHAAGSDYLWDFRKEFLPAGRAILDGNSPYPHALSELESHANYVYPPLVAVFVAPLTWLPQMRCRVDLRRALAGRAGARAAPPARARLALLRAHLPVASAARRPLARDALAAARARRRRGLALAALVAGAGRRRDWARRSPSSSCGRCSRCSRSAIAGGRRSSRSRRGARGGAGVLGADRLRRPRRLPASAAGALAHRVAARLQPHGARPGTRAAARGGARRSHSPSACRCSSRRSRWPGGRAASVSALSCAIAASLALSPVVWLHYLVLLIVPIAAGRDRLGARLVRAAAVLDHARHGEQRQHVAHRPGARRSSRSRWCLLRRPARAAASSALTPSQATCPAPERFASPARARGRSPRGTHRRRPWGRRRSPPRPRPARSRPRRRAPRPTRRT